VPTDTPVDRRLSVGEALQRANFSCQYHAAICAYGSLRKKQRGRKSKTKMAATERTSAYPLSEAQWVIAPLDDPE
jgi:hypothetical protein